MFLLLTQAAESFSFAKVVETNNLWPKDLLSSLSHVTKQCALDEYDAES